MQERPPHSRLRELSIAALAIVMASALGAGADPGPTTPSAPCASPAQVSWTALRFRARKFLLSATATFSLAVHPTAQERTQLRPTPTGDALAPSSPCLALLTFASELPVGRDERAAAWFDPSTGAVLQVDKRTVSGGLYRKVFRSTADGFYLWRTAPRNRREEGQTPDRWTKLRTAVIGGRRTLAPDDVVTDSYALLYLVSSRDLTRAGAKRTAYLLDEHGVVKLTFAAGGLTSRPIDVDLAWPGGSAHDDRQALLRTVTVSASPLGADRAGDEVDLGFLGISGTLTVALDVATGLPVELSGRTAAIGTLTATLEHAELSRPPRPPE
jgi:hypothetical protein